MKASRLFAYGGAAVLILIIAGVFHLVMPAKTKTAAPQEPLWLQYHEGLEKARTENKYIMVDFYTDWCTYCKKMDKEVYSQESIKKRLRESFTSVKVNAESRKKVKLEGKDISQKDLARVFRVQSYPTIWFIDPQGKPIFPLPGFLPADNFAMVLDYVSSASYQTTDFQAYTKNYKGK